MPSIISSHALAHPAARTAAIWLFEFRDISDRVIGHRREMLPPQSRQQAAARECERDLALRRRMQRQLAARLDSDFQRAGAGNRVQHGHRTADHPRKHGGLTRHRLQPAQCLGADGDEIHAAARGLAEKVCTRSQAVTQRKRILREIAALHERLQVAKDGAFARAQPLRHFTNAELALGSH
ncbi:MAG: hypothetical protein WDN44_06080 [Sphingomonas sp.]